MAETWRPVPGWPGYEASDRGRASSVTGGCLRCVLLPSRDRKGYPAVTVYRDGRKSTKRVHTLVALAWLGPRPRGKSVRHLDGDKDNCATWNLRYGTQPQQEWDKKQAGTSRVKRVRLRDGSENRETEGIGTGAYRAGASRTAGT